MKTFQQFILEAENRPVNSRQAFPMNSQTQRALNDARPIIPGQPKKPDVVFRLEPVKNPNQSVNTRQQPRPTQTRQPQRPRENTGQNWIPQTLGLNTLPAPLGY